MSFSDYSTTPANNTSIGGVSIAEGCAAGNLNDAVRQLAADGKALSDTVDDIDVSNLMPKSGGAFSGQITRQGRGGFIHHANATQSGGKVSILATGSSRPSNPSEGDMVFYY